MTREQPEILRVWRYGDSWCVVGSNGLGFFVGYASLPEGHPWTSITDYDDIDVDVHGGLTYGPRHDTSKRWDKWTGGDGVPDGWYIGFDCGHWCCTPIAGSLLAEYWVNTTEIHPPWAVEDVVREVERLALQIQVAAVAAHD